jgi:phosphatidylglycerol:prolipoprotein diacylglycerol transferase
MYPFFYIFGKKIPLYGSMFALAAFVSIGLTVIRAKKYGVEQYDALYMGLFAVIGAIIGAKILFIITIIPKIIQNWSDIIESGASVWDILYSVFIESGFVFFGGLIGGTIGGLIYLKIYKLSIPVFIDIAAPCVPLAHAIGRIGCFFGGCCYGIESKYGVYFNNPLVAPTDVKFLPVQLIEADINLLLVLILLIYERKRDDNKNNRGKNLLLYLIFYSAIRFTIEFFRGDSDRGLYFGVSTSQIISTVIFIIAIYLFVFWEKILNRKKENAH